MRSNMINQPDKISDSSVDLDKSVPKEIEQIYYYWDGIEYNPEEWLSDLEGKLAYVAGGGLPLVFGETDNVIWQAMEKALNSTEGKSLNIAGIDFTKLDFEVLGDFYRFIQSKDHSLHCIDERLEDDLKTTNTQVHECCGACAAMHSVIQEFLPERSHVEDLLLESLGLGSVGKQKIYDSMPNHESVTIFVDFSGDDAIADPQKRQDLRKIGGLAFQVSLPADLIQEFININNMSLEAQEQLISVLVKWSAGIARKIIAGHHNNLHQHESHTQLVIDRRGIKEQTAEVKKLTDKVQAVLFELVPHSRVVNIK